MILECPACHARFTVADAQIPHEGRTVRCSRCAHAWHASPMLAPEPPQPEPEPLSPDFLSQLESMMADEPITIAPRAARTHVPTAKKTKKKSSAKPYRIAAPAIAAVWLVVAFIAYFPSWADAPVLSGIYHAIGAEPSDGLEFADVSMERDAAGSKTKFIVVGSIRNLSNTGRSVPVVRVSLRDKDNKGVWGREYPVNNELKPGEVYPFRITNIETSFGANVSTIVVDMGNSLQLLVR